jgi:predicted ATPase/Tfp pilus assembly protein PilF
MFGPLQVLVDGQRVAIFNYHKAQALLAYLAVESDRAHRRDALVGLLWPDLPNDAARTNLRQALADLRQAIGDAHASPPFLHITRDTVQYNVASTHTLDVADFHRLLAACEAHPHRHADRCRHCAELLEQAVALYRGEFLAQFAVANSIPFEEWTVLQRERLHQSALEALTNLAACYERWGALDQACRVMARQIELDPWREEAHRALMRLQALNGQRSAALHQYEICRRILAHELDVEPEAETVALYWRIRDGGSSLPDGSEQLSQQLTRLPLPPTPLVDREEELARLDELLADPACRLITLHGPGGIGKTRLALAAAERCANAFADGVAFTPLEEIPSVEFLAPIILAALNVPLRGQHTPQEQLVAYLAGREVLLVLDSFEHLAADAAVLAELLRRSPGLTLLVTSQVRLGLRAEWLVDLGGLSCPPETTPHVGPVDLAQFGAARLLIQRIQQLQPLPALSAEDAQAVATICRLVAGMPLAIELAASAVAGRSVQEVATALAESMHMLEAHWQDAPSRHTSMRASLEHAWQLLSPGEQHMIIRLTVFRGGFQADAAFEVAGATLSDVRALVDKSLLQRDATGRYRMHRAVRPFAAEKLLTSGSAEETINRHLAYFLALAKAVEPRLRSSEQAAGIQRLELEQGNLRAALNAAFDSRQYQMAAELGGALWLFWLRGGHLAEGCAWLERALAHQGALPPDALAQVLFGLGTLLWHKGSYQAGRAAAEQSVVLWRSQDNRPGLAYALTMLGMTVEYQGDHRLALLYLEESVALFRGLDDSWGMALSLFHLGFARTMPGRVDGREPLVESLSLFQADGNRWGTGLALYGLGVCAYRQEQLGLARAYLERALAIHREIGDSLPLARILNYLGEVERCERAYEKAKRLYEESRALLQLLGSEGRIAIALHNLGHTACALGDTEGALTYFRQAIDFYRNTGHTWGLTACLEGVAGVLAARGQAVPAVRFLALTTTMHQEAGAMMAPADRQAHELCLSSLLAQLDDPSFAAAWAEGQQLTLEQAVDCAIDRYAWG